MKLTYEQIVKVQDYLCPYVRTPTENYKGVCAFGGRCTNWRINFKECKKYLEQKLSSL